MARSPETNPRNHPQNNPRTSPQTAPGITRSIPACAAAAALACLPVFAPRAAAAPITTTVVLALSGDAAPTGPANFSGFSFPVLNDAGQVAFRATLRGTGVDFSNNSGVYRGGGPGTSPATVQIARTGDAAPTGPGNFTSFSHPLLNDAGQAAFRANLGGTGVDGSNNSGLYLYDESLGLLKVAREGDALLSSTIVGLHFNDGFNNLGQVAYQFTLADGNSGIALFTIPEPNTAALALLSLAGLMPRRRWRA